MGVQSIDAEDDQFAYRYDTQLLIERRDEDLDEDDIADYITEHFEGNSLIAAGDEDLVKIHFHTNEPWKILEYCNSVGDNKESIERRFFPEIPSSERQRSRSDTERDRSSDHTRGILCRMAEGMGSRSSGRRDFQ